MAHHTILLIDYEPRSIERFRQPLTDAGYTVEVATDGITGIEAFHRLNPDMVLVEAMIPKRHGFEVCQELKRTPHGRRTPVLITTGVYKGRKYRTQALHIYGCDEYIEKPIAPEMLLAVVGKFFAGGSSNAAAESRAAASAVAANETAAPPKSVSPIATEPAAPRPSPPKPPITNSIVKDFTEEEIMARLDAILPGGDAIQPTPTEMPAVRTETPMSSMPMEVPDFIEMSSMTESQPQDPFAQMQAELSAELGSMSAALALDPAPVFDALPQAYPSDQALAPSLLEALPLAEEHAAPAPGAAVPIAAPTPAVPAESPGQLVNFDARRSRRNKKNVKAGAAERPAAATPPPAPAPVSAKITPIADARPAPAASISLPPGTLAEAELSGAAVRKGVPAWVWLALALLAVAAGYFAYTRFSSSGSEATASAPVQETQVAERQAEPVHTEAPATTKASDQHELVLNSIDPLPPRSAPPAPDASPPAAKTTPAAPAKTAAVTAPPHMFPVVPETTAKKAPSSPPASTHSTESQSLTAPAGADEGVAGLDPAPEPSAAPANAAPAVTPGALVDPEEVDTTPVSLARKVPIYSMQARQLRIQGTVILKVLVNERGTVDDVVLVQGVSGADLNDSAMRAAKSWTYRPATKAGVPVKAWKVEQVTFKL